jgi:FlaG/FlaF family flagellin (archaellin)
MRGLSTIIIIILFLMIAIALAALSYTFFVGAFQTVTKSGEQAISKATTSGQALMKIESVSEDKIYIRNIGQVSLSDISVYVGDVPASYTINPEVVLPGQVATITILNALSGEIEITTAEGALSIQGNYPGFSGAPADNPPNFVATPTNYPATYSTTQNTWMNTTWTDDYGISKVWTESSHSGSPVNYTPTQVGSIYYLRSILPAGTHSWESYANDTADQWSTSTTQTFTINKANPILSVTFAPVSPVTYPTSTTTTCTRTAGDSSATLTLYRNGTSVSSGTSPRTETITLGAAVYNYSCTIASTQNYSAGSSLNNYLTVNKGASTIYLYVDTVRASKSTTINTIVNYTSQMITPSSGNVELWTNFSNGVSKRWYGPLASPMVNLTNMTVAGVWNWFANYTGNQNYTADTEPWVVTVT